MKHKEIVKRIASWLKYTKRYTVVMAELSTRNSETPDVIGWIGGASSLLIECKATRSDFLSDKKKCFRRNPDTGVGDLRYYASPKGLIKPEELPEGWGLLEIDGRFVRETKSATLQQSNKRNECAMLMSAIRRLEISTAVYVVSEEDNKEE